MFENCNFLIVQYCIIYLENALFEPPEGVQLLWGEKQHIATFQHVLH